MHPSLPPVVSRLRRLRLERLACSVALLLLFPLVGPPLGAQAYYPGGFSNTNLKLWLDASVGSSLSVDSAGISGATHSGLVGKWKDLSGRNHHFVQGVTGRFPTWNQQAGALVFAGGQEVHRPLASSPAVLVSGTTTTPWSMSIVMQDQRGTPVASGGDSRVFHMGTYAQSNTASQGFSISTSFGAAKTGGGVDHVSTSNNDYLFNGIVLRYTNDPVLSNNTGPRTVYSSSPLSADPLVGQMVNASSAMSVGVLTMTLGNALSQSNLNPQLQWNGRTPLAGARSSTNTAQISTGSSETTSIGAVHSGGNIYRGFIGLVASVILYDKVLSTSERTILSNYLNAQHSPTVTLDSADCFSQEYDAATTRGCRFDLVGVGRASASDTVSRSQTSSRGLGFAVNNFSTASDGSYLMLAHNGADSSVAATTVSAGGNAYYRLNRVWKLQKTGFASAPATISMYFSMNDHAPKTATYTPYGTDNTTYALLRSATADMATATTVVATFTTGVNSDNNLQTRLDFSVPIADLTSGYYTIGCIPDSSLGRAVFLGSILPTSVGDITIPASGAVTLSGNTDINGTLSVNTGSTLTVPDNTIVTVKGTFKQSGGSINLGTNSQIIIKTTKSYMKGTGGSITLGAGAGIRYEYDANLYYTGSGGTSTVGPEWPTSEGPDRVRLTGSNVVTMSGNRTIGIEARFQNGIFELNGHTLTMKGFSSRENGKIRGGFKGTTSSIIIDGVTQKFNLPEVLGGLQSLRIDNTTAWTSPDPTVELNSSLVIHGDLHHAYGILSIAGASNSPNELRLCGTISKNTGTIRGGAHSSLAISDSTGNLPQVTLPPIIDGLKELVVDRRNGVKLGSDLTVTTSATLATGIEGPGTLDVDTRTLTLGSSASLIGETASNPITGTVDSVLSCGRITTTRSLSSSVNGETFGNIGVAITTNTPMGSTTVTRNYSQWFAGPAVVNGEYRKSIKRTYTISPTSNSSLDATLVFRYHDGALDGQTESSLKLIRKDPVNGAWQVQSATVADPVANTLTLTGIPAFSEWSAEDGISVLPVELVSFSGIERNGHVQLSWKTATETNNYGFEVERRTGASGGEASMHAQSLFAASTWQNIGFVAGGGTTSSERRYSFSDDLRDGAGAMPALSYRLRQIDRDGTVDYSPVVVVTRSSTPPASAMLAAPHPNPATNGAAATLTLPLEAPVRAMLYTMEGRLAATLIETQVMGAGVHTIVIPRPAHALGTYLLVVQTDGRRLVRPVTFLQ